MTPDTIFQNQNEEKQTFVVGNSEEDDEERRSVSLSPSISVEDQSQPSIIPSQTVNHLETLDDKELNKLFDDSLELDAQLRSLEPKHKEYVRKLDEVESLKTKYKAEFEKYKKKLDRLQKNLAKIKKTYEKKGSFRLRFVSFISLIDRLDSFRRRNEEKSCSTIFITIEKFSFNIGSCFESKPFIYIISNCFTSSSNHIDWFVTLIGQISGNVIRR